MSALSKEVSLIFKGVNETSDTIDSIIGDTNKLSNQILGVASPVADVTKSILAFQAALIGAGAALVGYATKVAGDFDTSFREIATLVDVPLDALEELRQGTIDYIADSTATTDQITSGLYAAISAGVEYTDALGFVRQAEELSIATKSDLGQAVETVAGVMNAYGLEAADQTRIQDQFFAIVKNGITTFSELQASIGQVVPVASAAGVEFDEVGAALATLTAQGQKTPQAVTNLASAINALLNPSAQAAALAEELGIELGASALATNGLQGQMQILEQATGGNVEQLSQLVGSSTALQAVLGLTGEGAALFSDNLDEMANSAGAVATAAETMRPALQNLQGPLSAFFITLGTPFLDVFRENVESISSIINSVTSSLGESDQLGGIVEELESVFDRVTAVIADVAKNLPEALGQADFSGFIAGIQSVADAIANIFKGIDLGTTSGLVTAIETIGTAFAGLGEFTAQVINVLAPAMVELAKAIPTLINFAAAIAPYAGLIGGVAIALTTILPILNAFLAAMVLFKGAAIGVSLAALTPVLAPLAAAIGVVAAAFAAWKLGEWMADNINVGELLEGLVDSIRAAIEQAGEIASGARDFVSDAAAGISDGVSDGIDRLRERGSSLRDAVTGLLTRPTVDEALANVDLLNNNLNSGLVDTRDIYDQLAHVFENDSLANATENFGASLSGLSDLLSNIDWDDGPSFDAFKQAIEEVGGAVDDLSNNEIAALYELMRDNPDITLGDAVNLIQSEFSQIGGSAEATRDDIERSFTDINLDAIDFDVSGRVEIDNVDSETQRIKSAASDWNQLAFIEGSIEIANIQSETQKVESAFDSINSTIEIASSSIDTLVQAMLGIDDADANARAKIETFTNALDRQIEIQEQAANSQSRLINAQVAELQAKTARLQSGDAIINIDGGGLEPELEAFMFRILQKIQMRANADASAFLLGV